MLGKACTEVRYTKVQLASLLGVTVPLCRAVSLLWPNSVSAPACSIMSSIAAGVLSLRLLSVSAAGIRRWMAAVVKHWGG